MLIRIGYDIALRFANPAPVFHLLHVHPSRQSDLVEPETFPANPLFLSKSIMTVSATVVDVFMPPQGFFAYLARQSSVTAAHPMRTRPTRRSRIFLSFLAPLWSFCCPVDIARWTVTLWISPGVPFFTPDRDGNGFKRFATLFTDIFNSIISRRGAIEPHSTLSESRRESAETSRIWPSPSAAA